MIMKRAAAVLLLIAAGAALEGRLSFGAKEKPKIKILTTVFPLQEFIRETAGSRGEVNLLLPPGAEVHTWQPKVSDIRKLTSCDVFISIGMGLEPWAKDILKGVPRSGLKVFEVGREIGGLPEDPSLQGARASEARDPHIWLDFGLDQTIVKRIRDFLTVLEPDQSAYFADNAARYNAKLRRLDDQCRQAFDSCLHKTFIFGGHAAFGYFARRYGLEQIAVYGLSPDAAPTPKVLAAAIDETKRRNIKTIFFEPGVSDKMARLIAREVGADIRLLNPGHTLTRDQIKAGVTFLDLMASNLESFKHGLSCR